MTTARRVPTSNRRPTEARRKTSKVREPTPGTIQAFAERQLLWPRRYSVIVAMVRVRFPDARTTVASLRWYAAQMRRRGINLPDRPMDLAGGGG